MNVLIKRPIISEKTMRLAKDGCYSFMVAKMARKLEIKAAIEHQFDVGVVDIRTSNFKDQRKQQRRVRSTYIIPGFKKVVVKLKVGQKISLFEATSVQDENNVGETEVKEKKSLLKRTKVKIERSDKGKTSNDKTENKEKKGEKE